MRKPILLLITLLLATASAWAQCTTCSATTFTIDLSGATDTSIVIESTRNGNCCSGTNCIRFNITLHPGANFVNMSVANPAPNGSAFYQINCGPQTSLGTPICVTGLTTLCISYCKPGNDNPQYTISTSSGVRGSDDLTLREGCTGSMWIEGLQAASVSWSSIFPGAQGAYNGYLSCVSGCQTTQVTPVAGAPPFIDYLVSGNSICGNFRRDTIRVYTAPPLLVSITPPNPMICSGNSVALQATASGGNPPYRYTWNTGATTQTINATAIGTYSVSVSDNTSGCVPVPQTITVGAAPLPAAPAASSNSPVCTGASLQLSATAVAGATYRWTGPNGFTSTLQNPVISNMSAAQTGTYSVTVTVNGCTSLAASTQVAMLPTPLVSAVTPPPVCAGGNLQLSATSDPGASWQWTGPHGFSSALQAPAINGIPTTLAGIYTVIATLNGCPSLPVSVPVSVIPRPASPLASSNAPICQGGSLQMSAQAAAGASYQWTGPNGFSSTLQNPALSAASPAQSGTYTVIAIENGCSSLPATVQATIHPTPAPPQVAANSPVCAGAPIMLSVTETPGATYAWSGPNGFTASGATATIGAATAAQGGSYSVTATINGCTGPAASIPVTVLPLPAALAFNNGPVCAGGSVSLEATAPAGAGFSWTGPGGFSSSLQNPVISGIAATQGGIYTVTATLNGCSGAPASTQVTVHATPDAPTAGSNSPVCEGAVLHLNVSPVAGASYQWTGPNGFSSTLQHPQLMNVSLTQGGTYTVRAFVNGCAGPETSIQVLVNPTPVVSASANSPVCTDAQLDLTATGSNGASYQWTGPNGASFAQQNPSIANVTAAQAGTYTVVALLNGCASAAATTNVLVTPLPPAPVTGSNSPVCAGASLNLTASGPAGAVYTWSGPAGFSSSQGNPALTAVSPLQSGNYSVSVTLNGCTGPAAVLPVVVHPTPAAPVASANTPVCAGADLQLSANGIASTSFQWSGPNGFTSAQQNPVIAGVMASQAGTYFVTATENGCTGPATSVQVTVNPTPTASATASSPVCAGNAITLSADGTPGATYTWSGPSGFTSNQQQAVINPAQPPMSGTYTVVPTLNGCSGPADSVDVTVHPTPQAPSVSSNAPVCAGASLQLNTGSIAGATFQWTGPNGYTSSDQNPVINSISTGQAGNYSVHVVVNGCAGPATSIPVAILPIPVATAGSNSPVCAGAMLLLSAGSGPGASYQWTGPNGFSSTQQNPAINSISTAQSGTYSVVATINGCVSAAATVDVLVTPLPPAPAATSNSPLCPGATLALNASAPAGATFNWSGPSGFSSTQQNPSIPNVSAAQEGTYTVRLTLNGCSGPAALLPVTVHPLPLAPVATSNSPVCSGSSLQLSVMAQAGFTYQWSGPGGFSATGPVQTIPGMGTAQTGTYSVTASANGCTGPAASIGVALKPTPVASAANSGPVCAGSSFTLTATAPAGASFSWSGPGGFSSTLAQPVVTASNTAQSGTYSVVVTVDGCSSVAATTDVLVYPIPDAPVLSNNGPACAGAPLQLSATAIPGAGYQWSGPGGFSSTLQNILIDSISTAQAGIYSATVTVNGCSSASGSTQVVIKPTPVVTAGSNAPVCAGSTLQLHAAGATGLSYQWTGPNGFTSTQQNPSLNPATVAQSGTYQVMATLDGCNSLASTVPVLVRPLPEAPVVNSNSPICAGDSIRLSAAPSVLTAVPQNATYTWTGPNGFSSVQPHPVITGATPAHSGTYSATMTVDGCTGPASAIAVLVHPLPATPLASSNAPVCSGNTLQLQVATVAGGSYQWTGPGGFSSTDQNPSISAVTGSHTGDYAVTVTVNGCSSPAATLPVVVKPTPTVAMTSNTPVCQGAALSLSATGTAGVSYSWTGPGGFVSTLQNPVIGNAQPAHGGSYTLTVTLDGCSSIPVSTEVLVHPLPAAPAATANSPVCAGATLQLTTPDIIGGTFQWSGPNGFTSTQQSPVIGNIGAGQAGTYSLTVRVNGCSSTASTVSVAVISVAPPTALSNSPICAGGTLQLSAAAAPGVAFLWTGPAGFTSNQPAPNIANISGAQAGTYQVMAQANGCNSAATSIEVRVTPLPPAPLASFAGPACAGGSLQLSASSIGGASYLWTGPNGYNATQQNPVIANATTSQSGSYSVQATVHGCTGPAGNVNVTIAPLPPAPAASSNSALCEGATLNLSASSVPGASYTWTGPNGFSSGQQNPVVGAARPSQSGVYTVRAIVAGCSSAPGSTSVTIHPRPLVQAVQELFVHEGQSVTLQPQASGSGIRFRWTPARFLSSDTAATPLCMPEQDISYTVQVTNAAGCTAATNIRVRVLLKIHIPNVFTPNGDGTNDTWNLKGLESYPGATVLIFNRYGQQVFESRGYARPWDGTYRNQPLPSGTFYYLIQPGHGVKQLSGFVDLIR